MVHSARAVGIDLLALGQTTDYGENMFSPQAIMILSRDRTLGGRPLPTRSGRQAAPNIDRGAVVAEYAMLFAFVVIVAIVALSALGVSVLELHTSNAERFGVAVQPSIGN